MIHFILSIVEQVKSKWKNLSDGFKKCLDRKRDLEKSGSGYSKPPTCRFYNQLLFLRDAVSNRNTHSNVQVQSISLGTPSSTEEALPEPLTATSVSSLGNEPPQQNQNQQPPVPPTTQPPPKEKLQFPQATVIPKKRKKVELDPVEEYLIKSIEKKEEKKSLAGKQDPDEQFCLSIIHTLRRLGEQSMKKNQLAKIKIQQLLFEIEFDD